MTPDETKSELIPIQIRLDPIQIQAIDRIADAEAVSRPAVVRSFLPLDPDQAQAIQAAAFWLAIGDTRGFDSRFQVRTAGDAFWAMFANGLRYTMLRAGISRTQLDMTDDYELVAFRWPAFVAVGRNRIVRGAQGITGGAQIVDGAAHGQDGEWVLLDGEVWPENEPFPIPREDLAGRYEADEPAADETGGAQ